MAWPYPRLLVEKHTEDPKEEKGKSGLVIQKHTEGLGRWRRNGLGTHVAPPMLTVIVLCGIMAEQGNVN